MLYQVPLIMMVRIILYFQLLIALMNILLPSLFQELELQELLIKYQLLMNCDICRKIPPIGVTILYKPNIDASSTSSWNSSSGLSPIGNDVSNFTGFYDGQSNAIDGLTISRGASDYIGLFGYLNDANIANLTLTNANISGQQMVGALAGEMSGGNSIIDNCNVSGTISGVAIVGGLVGKSVGLVGNFSTIQNSSSSTTINATKTDDWSDVGGLIGDVNYINVLECFSTSDVTAEGRNVGGLIGWVHIDVIVRRSYATGNVTINSGGIATGEAGGLIGSLSGNNTIIKNCYSTGNVNVDNSENGGVGGFIGQLSDNPTIENNYAAGQASNNTGNIGGFIGEFETPGSDSPTLSNNFWDTDVSVTNDIGGSATSANVLGRSTVEMTEAFAFSVHDWDLDPIGDPIGTWTIDESETAPDNNGYPALAWQNLTNNYDVKQASGITFPSIGENQMSIDWTNGDGSRRAVFMKQDNSGTASPLDNNTYSANTTFASGSQIGTTGWYCVYNGVGSGVSVTGLSAATDYIVQVAEYDGTSGTEKYLTSSAVNNPKTQNTYQLPTVTTQSVSGISPTSATGNGNIMDLGTPDPTQYGVCWSTSENPTTADSKTEEGGIGVTGAFTTNITNLEPLTTYYVKSYATNSAGTVYGSQVSFTTTAHFAGFGTSGAAYQITDINDLQALSEHEV